jgi:excisionase family DNA binding protein
MATPHHYEEPLLTVKEAAPLLNMSCDSLYRRIKSGTIPAVKFGRSYRIRLSVVSELTGPGQSGG